MKIWILLLLVLSTHIVFCQNTVDAKGLKQGKWIKYYQDSKIPIYTGQFKDSHPIGEFRYYYPTGKVKAILHNESFTRCFAWYYFENEKLMSTGQFISMKKDSIWLNYNNEGLLLCQENYKQNNLDGLKLTYYIENQRASGELKIHRSEIFKDSILHGDYQIYYSSGKIMEKGRYQNGKREGLKESFHVNGKLESLVKYRIDLAYGYAYAYDEEGNEIYKVLYRLGEKQIGEELKKYLDYCTKKGINPDE